MSLLHFGAHCERCYRNKDRLTPKKMTIKLIKNYIKNFFTKIQWNEVELMMNDNCPPPQMVCPRAWSPPGVNVMGEWRFNTKDSGEPCVVKTGPCPMLRWCVISWDAGRQWASLAMHSLAKAPGLYGKPVICVLTLRHRSSNAHSVDTTAPTVATNRMPVLSVQVRCWRLYITEAPYITEN